MPLITNSSMNFVIGRRGIDNFIMGRCRDSCELCKKSMFIDLTDVVQSIHVGYKKRVNESLQLEDNEWNTFVSYNNSSPYASMRQPGYYSIQKKKDVFSVEVYTEAEGFS